MLDGLTSAVAVSADAQAVWQEAQPEPIRTIVAPHVAAALDAIGRTEDLQFSPDNTRLAIVGFARDSILIIDVRLCEAGGSLWMALNDHVKISSDALCRPHGLCWIDDETLAVANREGSVAIFSVPRSGSGSARHTLAPLALIEAGQLEHLSSPGSLLVQAIGSDLLRVLVCDNHAHHVTEHLLDRSNGYAVCSSLVMLRADLDIPDGIAMCPQSGWLAVSNHSRHCVHLHAPADCPVDELPPDGVLRGMSYPHGLAFTRTGEHVLVADAGEPCVHVYARPAEGWRGTHHPIRSVRVVDESTFTRGHHNEQEGGPKGLAIDRTGRVLALTCEQQPLLFLSLADVIGVPSVDDQAAAPPQTNRDLELEVLRRQVRGARRSTWLRGDRERGLRRQLNDELTAIKSSRSWRLTAPLRAFNVWREARRRG
jgi:hypothetical protein